MVSWIVPTRPRNVLGIDGMETHMTTQHLDRMSMTAQTIDPMRQNPIRSIVASIRAMDDDLTPRQQQIRDNGRRRTEALVSTGLYSFAASA